MLSAKFKPEPKADVLEVRPKCRQLRRQRIGINVPCELDCHCRRRASESPEPALMICGTCVRTASRVANVAHRIQKTQNDINCAAPLGYGCLQISYESGYG